MEAGLTHLNLFGNSQKRIIFPPKKQYEKSDELFSNIRDPRIECTREHDLEDILFIAIASVICGAESRYEMEAFGKAKEEWLKTFLHLPGGILSHDTFNRVFSAPDPVGLEKGFVART